MLSQASATSAYVDTPTQKKLNCVELYDAAMERRGIMSSLRHFRQKYPSAPQKPEEREAAGDWLLRLGEHFNNIDD